LSVFHKPIVPDLPTAPPSRLSSRDYTFLAAVVAAGLLCSLILFLTLRTWERRTAQAAVESATAQRIELLHETLSNSLEALQALGSFIRTEPSPTRLQFRRFVDPLLARRPELHALSWTPQVTTDQRAVYEARAHADGIDGFQFTEVEPATGHIIPARERDTYYPVYYIEPAATNATALGFDLNHRIATLAKARDLGTAFSTPPLQLVQEPDNLPGFIVYLPIYTDGPNPSTQAERRTRLSGFVAAVFRVATLVDPALAHLPGFHVSLMDATSDTSIAYDPPRADSSPVDKRLNPTTRSLPYAGREWSVTFTPTTAFEPGLSHNQSWGVLTSGLALTFLLTAYLHRGLRARREAAAANLLLQSEVIERKRAEDAAAAANNAKSDFLAGLSHEIRTPLNSILGYAQILERDPDLLLRQRDSVAALTSSGRHLLGLLNSILDLSKIEAGRAEMRREIFDLRALVRELADMFKPRCAEKKLTLRVLLPDDLPASVVGDEGKLRQVLINLLGNAVKFTPRGEIIVSVTAVGADCWRFAVIDTGIGLVEAERGGLFTPFQQTAAGHHHGGTGLGLALARRHVELMGGEIEAVSEPGTGTRFYFTLSLPASLLPCSLAQERLPRLAPGVSVRALVVDDNRDNRIILARLLVDIGCRVASAGTAADACATAAEQPPDILFVDVRLEGTTGPQLVAQLHASGLSPATPVVYHTAALLDAAGREALRVNGADLLAKPFRIEDLCACLQRVPGVSFDDAPESAEPPPLDLTGLSLPSELAHRLSVAAELHSTTVLKACLDELRQLGGPAVPLADHLRHLLRSYDLVSISQLLAGLPVDRTEPATAQP
jgi:signal transduction histidine kinase/ActR/RegA family two-component response regulator